MNYFPILQSCGEQGRIRGPKSEGLVSRGRLHRLDHDLLPPLHRVGARHQILVKRESSGWTTYLTVPRGAG
jgi:hypothetical protein